MSSISPIETKEFAKRINELGCDYLDAPVSGGEVGAKAATLTIMVGGPEAAFEQVKPLFELMGKNITLVGGNGDGQTTKVANQIIVALTIEAVGEALLFAAKAGADPAKVRQALMGGFASSRILEVHGERMIKRTFESGLPHRAAPEGLNLALSGARAWRVACPTPPPPWSCSTPAPPTAARRWDHSGMVKALELMANHRSSPKLSPDGMDPRAACFSLFEAAVAARRTRAVPGAPAAAAAGRTIVIGRRQGVGRHGQGGRGSLAGPLSRAGRHPLRPRRALPRIEIVEAAHPVPDAAGRTAAAASSSWCRAGRGRSGPCLISGGGSALLALPAPGLTLDDKQAVNRRCCARAPRSTR